MPMRVDTAPSTGTGATFGAPALTFSTTNAAGTTGIAIATDAQIALFDATLPSTSLPTDAGNTGSAPTAARRDHQHVRERVATHLKWMVE